jgi:hypothetical protein
VGSENEFALALSGKRLTDATVQQLDQLFRRCMIKVGIRANNLPSKEETLVLYDHLLKHYGRHTIEEIDLAFEMAITGKLEVDANPFENFSCAYISRIINAFRGWAAQAVQHLPSKNQGETSVQIGNRIDWRELIQADYEGFLLGSAHHKLWPVEYYEQLVADGFIYPFLYKERMEDCRKEICSELQLKIVVEKDPLRTEIEEYNNTMDLEKKLMQYREGKREFEVMLLAKQYCVLMLFVEASRKKMKQLYVKQ